MNDVQRAVQALVATTLADVPAGDRHVQAVVTAVAADGTATVKWAGQSFGTRRNAGYTAALGDQVLVVFANGSPVILCKIA